MNFKIKTYCQAHKRQNEISFLWSFDIEKLFPQQYLHFFLPFHFSLETLYRLRENHPRHVIIFCPNFFSESGKSSLKPCWPSWIIPSPPPLSVRVTFCSSKNLPRSSQEFEPRLFYLSPCQFPSSFYRAYTTLISSSNDNTLHIYDRSRGNQKAAGNNFLFLSFEGFLSKVFSDFFQKFFPCG